jgi:hypothetical protein
MEFVAAAVGGNVADPLENLHDAESTQLARIRELYGQVVTSETLRSEIHGFRGQKGIYKPGGSDYALWVRETSRGAYPDREPTIHPDGSWTYPYSPEGRDGQTDLDLASNRGLLACQNDRRPVGVFREVDRIDGKVAYQVLGLAYVEGYDGHHFLLRGESIDVTATPLVETFVPAFQMFEGPMEAIESLQRQIRDQRFGVVIRQLYHEKCSLCEVGYRLRGKSIGLDAAHIIPLKSHGVIADVRNGLLLCKNHHALFDDYGWTIDEDLRVRVAPEAGFRRSAAANHVLGWEGKKLPNVPARGEDNPAPEAIRWRLDAFDRAWA